MVSLRSQSFVKTSRSKPASLLALPAVFTIRFNVVMRPWSSLISTACCSLIFLACSYSFAFASSKRCCSASWAVTASAIVASHSWKFVINVPLAILSFEACTSAVAGSISFGSSGCTGSLAFGKASSSFLSIAVLRTNCSLGPPALVKAVHVGPVLPSWLLSSLLELAALCEL